MPNKMAINNIVFPVKVDGGASTLPGQVSGGPPAPPVLGGPSGGLPGGLFPGQIDADAKKVGTSPSEISKV